MFEELNGFAALIGTALEGHPHIENPFRLFRIALATGIAAATAHRGLVHYMAIPADSFSLTNTTSYESGEEKWRAVNQENFDLIGEATLGLGSALLGLSSSVEIHARDAENWIDSYFPRGKSLWWSSFVGCYEAGRFETHPRRLLRSIPAIESLDSYVQGTNRDRRASATLINHTLDLSSPEAAMAVVERGLRDVDNLWRAYELVAAHLIDTGTSVADLLGSDGRKAFSALISAEDRRRADLEHNAHARQNR